MTVLSALYYPFSRCINELSLKQMLLVFDRVCFLDPIEDHEWRAYQFERLEQAEDPRYRKYRSLSSQVDRLQQMGIVERVSPAQLSLPRRSTVSASAISDLLDPAWVETAAHPERFSLPHRTLAPDGSATWNIFRHKLPDEYVTALLESDDLRKHLIRQGDETSSWTVSYAAGSAAAVNVHLAAAEELALAPVTDSAMHHLLLVGKALREKYPSTSAARPIPSQSLPTMANNLAISLVHELFPPSRLCNLAFEDIMVFREQTASQRLAFVQDLQSRLAVLTRVPDADDLVHAQREIQIGLQEELRKHTARLSEAGARIWPGLVSSLNSTLAGGGIAAVTFTSLGGPGCILAGSIVAASMAFLKSTLDVKREVDNAQASASPAVNYLSTLKGKLAS